MMSEVYRMEMKERVSTGMLGFDRVIDDLRLGDNVVWQVDSVAEYKEVVIPYVQQAIRDGRNLIYIRFGSHEPLLGENSGATIHVVDPTPGFEVFAMAVHDLIREAGLRAFYVFDCLSELLPCWHSDLVLGNFFKVTCPYLYELDTVAYFAILRNEHTFSTIAGIRETTQLLLDLYYIRGKQYIHPLRVFKRYSPTMFFPHLIDGETAVSVTSSAEAAELFSKLERGTDRPDHWDEIFAGAREDLRLSPAKQEETKDLLLSMLVGSDERMLELCKRYFTLSDVLSISSHEIGSGRIGGKSVGMLLARKIVETNAGEALRSILEPHDSFYIGSDVFYAYIVQNGWWRLRVEQRTKDGYFSRAPELHDKLLNGDFPDDIREQFVRMIEYFGQSPIIVRSSSLLEDNFGNAFAGKYESVFCVNQGSPAERYAAFSRAVRHVYASTMNRDALSYRLNRGMSNHDEQMAILVQRVSGDYHGDNFFPHVAGVGNSSNLYVWDSAIDMSAGMLRLVFGLGTRAVDRTVGDYARIVTLDDPMRLPLINQGDKKKFSQHKADVLSISENTLTDRYIEDLTNGDIKTDKWLFISEDAEALRRLSDRGQNPATRPVVLDFHKLLSRTDFAERMKEMLSVLESAYAYPVDTEYTANFRHNGSYTINLLQCRPLQTRGPGATVSIPQEAEGEECVISTYGGFMGGNIRTGFDYVIYVSAIPYLALNEAGRYETARIIGRLNEALSGARILLVGPGRWGTTTTALGVPVHFSEISSMTVLCEVASPQTGMMPEVSYGSHFFQDLVETGIFYAAVFTGEDRTVYHPERILAAPNLLSELLPGASGFSETIRVVQGSGLQMYADIATQRLLCQ